MSVSNVIIGVDPGTSGGMATLSAGTIQGLCLLSNEPYALRWLETWRGRSAMAYVEHAQAMPRQGVTSMFNYGTNFGRICGWLEAFGIPYQLVKPRRWQLEMHRGWSGSTPKEKSIVGAQRLFPGEDFRGTDRARKPHLGLLEAALIAEYGRRHHAGILKAAEGS